MEHTIHAAHFMDRVLDPLAACLNREASMSIIDLRIDPEIQARVEVLAERANEGTLTPDERAEYLSYYPGEEDPRAGGYQPDAPARVGRLFPRWRVGLVFVTFFHAGVIC